MLFSFKVPRKLVRETDEGTFQLVSEAKLSGHKKIEGV
jgi:hypothetical protein